MTPRSLQRLAALVAPLLPQLPPHERAEAVRLLRCAPPLPPDQVPPGGWPYDCIPVTQTIAREEYPLAPHQADYGR